MKIPIMDTPIEVKHLKYIAGFIEATFLSHLHVSQAYRVNYVLNQGWQLGSSVRELNIGVGSNFPLGGCMVSQ